MQIYLHQISCTEISAKYRKSELELPYQMMNKRAISANLQLFWLLFVFPVLYKLYFKIHYV
jgi:hypothetical protein